jgi:hypothetical protein
METIPLIHDAGGVLDELQAFYLAKRKREGQHTAYD